MSVITNLDIVLAAKTGDLDRGLDGGRRKLNEFASDTKASSTALAAFEPAANLARGSLGRLIEMVPGLGLAVELFQDMRAAALAANTAQAAAAVAGASKSSTDKQSVVAVTATAAAATKVATETKQAANEAQQFLAAMIAAAMAARSIKIGSGTDLTAGSPRAFVRQPPRIAGPVAPPDFIDAEFKVLGSRSIPAASTAVAGLGITGTAAMGALAVGIGAAIAGAVGLAIAVGNVNAEMVAIDDATDKANQLGVSFSELVVLRGALGEASGLDSSGIDDAIKKFEINLVEAAETGKGKAAESLAKLGLDAKVLLAKGPQEAITEIAGSFDQLNGKAEQLSAAKNLFGNLGSQLVGALREGEGVLDNYAEHAASVGLLLSDAQAEQVGSANDAWARVEEIATGVWRQIAAEAAPVITVISEGLYEWLQPLGGIQVVMPTIVDTLAYAAGLMVDIYEVATLTHKTMGNIATLNFSQIGEDWSAALSFNTGEDFVKKIQDARAAAREAANDKNSNRMYGADAGSDLATQKESAAAEAKLAADEKLKKAREDGLARLRDEVTLMQETVALGEEAAKAAADRRKFAADVGNDPGVMAEFDRLAAAKAQAQKDKEAADEKARKADQLKANADQLAEQMRKPEDILSSKLTELEDLFSKGLINEEVAARAAKAAQGDFASAMSATVPAPPPSVGAVQGVAAYSAAMANDKAMKQENLQAKANELTGQTNALLEKILNRAPQALIGV